MGIKNININKLLVIDLILLFFIFCVSICGFIYLNKESFSVGINIVKALYEFNSLEELQSNVNDLENLTSEEVFKNISLDNESRVISTYLKFQTEPSKVNIINDYENCVLYSIDSKYVNRKDIYVLYFELYKGKIDYIREYKLIDL